MEAERPEFGPLESMSKAGIAASTYNQSLHREGKEGKSLLAS